MPTASHRIVGVLACNALFTERDAAVKAQQDAVLSELGLLQSLSVLGPEGYGRFETELHVVRRGNVAALTRDEFLSQVATGAFREHRTTGALVLLDVRYSPPKRQRGEAKSRALSLTLAASLVVDTLRSLAYAAQIARPGACDSVRLFAAIDEPARQVEEAVLIGDFWAAREYCERTGWPTLHSLSVVAVWQWLALNFLPQRFGDTALSRAFNALTYLCAHDLPESLQFLTALIGLEALFGSGRPGIAAQIVERTQLVLGQKATFKGDLRRMYELRSAIAHGGYGIPPFGTPYAEPVAYEKRRADLLEARALATAVLIATLQEMQRKDATHVGFAETVAMRSEPFDPNVSGDIGHSFIRIWAADLHEFIERFGPKEEP